MDDPLGMGGLGLVQLSRQWLAFSFVIIGLLCYGRIAHAQESDWVSLGDIKVTSAAALTAKPAKDAKIIQQVSSGASAKWIEDEQKNGFYRVLLGKGVQGWIPVTSVTAQPAPQSAMMVAAAQSRACQASLEVCPVSGCAAPGSPNAAMNLAKHHMPEGSLVTLSFADFASLEQKADDLFGGQSPDLTTDQREELRNLDVSGGTVGEGSLVRLTGFIAQGNKPHPNTGESVNCNLRGAGNNDFHIPLAETADKSDFEGIVVEMIPQGRSSGWTLDKLIAIKAAGRRVLVSGDLFFDNKHVPNTDPANPIQGQPPRFSLWEIHPIAAFGVCNKENSTCDVERASDWTPLDEFTP
jgi:hypothetical protein